MALPTRRLLNAMWSFMTENATAEQRAELEAKLADAADLVDDRRPAARQPARVPAGGPRRPDPAHVPGLAPRHIPAPSWWRGDRAAYRSSVAAAEELGEPAAKLARVV